MDNPKRKKRGKHISWTEADIDAQLTPEALQVLADEVASDWAAKAPAEAKNALEAKEEEEDASST